MVLGTTLLGGLYFSPRNFRFLFFKKRLHITHPQYFFFYMLKGLKHGTHVGGDPRKTQFLDLGHKNVSPGVTMRCTVYVYDQDGPLPRSGSCSLGRKATQHYALSTRRRSSEKGESAEPYRSEETD